MNRVPRVSWAGAVSSLGRQGFLLRAFFFAVIAFPGCGLRPLEREPEELPQETGWVRSAEQEENAIGTRPRTTVVVDIDETISATDYASFFGPGGDSSRPHRQAREVLTEISGDFGIIYLTARPQWLFSETRAWLKDNGFPAGPVLTTARLVDVFWPGPFKARLLALLRRHNPEILIGIGDRVTDEQAYRFNKMISLAVHRRAGADKGADSIVLADWSEIGKFFQPGFPR